MLDYEELDDGWLVVTAGLPGENAVAPRWKAEPDVAARAIGEGLALLHSLDPSDCLFETPEWVGVQDDIDLLVVAHGDACAPNTLLSDDGAFLGHVDVGDLGVADRWADLAIASWSLEWNFGPGHEQPFWDAYGIAPDPDRIAHYRRLWGEPPTLRLREEDA
jgi:kanamycin kinase